MLLALRADLDAVITALDGLSAGDGARRPGGRRTAPSGDGNVGYARIPGKHGGGADVLRHRRRASCPTRPGRSGQLFTDMGEAGVNLEDLHLEHGLGPPFGLAEVSVLPASVERLLAALDERGWRVHD